MSHCDDIIRRANQKNIDECEAISIEKKILTVRITDSAIAEIKQNYEESFAVRLIHNKKIMSAKSTVTDDIIAKCIESQHFSKPKNFWRELPKPSRYSKIQQTYDSYLDKIQSSDAVDIANEMINSSTKRNITRISGVLHIVSEDFHIRNSQGLDAYDKSTFISGTINTESDIGSVPVSGIGSNCARVFDMFSAQGIGIESAEMCIGSINPKKIETGNYSIILEPYAIGELLAFVLQSNFSLKAFSEKRSCFTGKMNTEIANNSLTLLDDPLSPNGIGSKPFDDEGIPTDTRGIIESGIFKGLYSDSFEAFKNNEESSANAARPGSPMGRSSLPIPISQPHNLKIEKGDMKKDEIIQDTKNGIIVGRLWYTYPVNPEQGDFSCTARSGIRIIDNGTITHPGKSVRIVYNLKPFLKNISAIGNDSRNVLQWHSLPTITPTIRSENIPIVSI